jgi:hypothetical protein
VERALGAQPSQRGIACEVAGERIRARAIGDEQNYRHAVSECGMA